MGIHQPVKIWFFKNETHGMSDTCSYFAFSYIKAISLFKYFIYIHTCYCNKIIKWNKWGGGGTTAIAVAAAAIVVTCACQALICVPCTSLMLASTCSHLVHSLSGMGQTTGSCKKSVQGWDGGCVYNRKPYRASGGPLTQLPLLHPQTLQSP